MATLRVTYDLQTDAAYIYLAEIKAGDIVRTEVTETGLILNFDSEGRLLGVEALDASHRLSNQLLAEANSPNV